MFGLVLGIIDIKKEFLFLEVDSLGMVGFEIINYFY